MKSPAPLLAAAALLAAALPVLADGSAGSGLSSAPANRIVGFWQMTGEVGPCSSAFRSPLSALFVFHAGGTLSTSDTFPQAGIPNAHGIAGVSTRGPGYGRWDYDPVTRRYSSMFRFNWFVDGVYHGYQEIHRELQLSADGQTLSGPIRAARHFANGAKYMDFCGEETSTRL